MPDLCPILSHFPSYAVSLLSLFSPHETRQNDILKVVPKALQGKEPFGSNTTLSAKIIRTIL